MPTNERLRSIGLARSRRILGDLAVELRHARFEAGLSQEEVGRRCGLSGDKIWRLENQRFASLSIADACAISSVLGMELSARVYPSGARIRDAAQTPRLLSLLSQIAKPLSYRTDVPLPAHGGTVERRAWDALVYGADERTGIELETRLTDFQATTRRHNLKRRDDPVEHFLLVVADTRHNRRVLREFESVIADLPRLRPSIVLGRLRAGKHPPTGFVLI